MATGFSCCDLHFNCLDCPIITGPDCVPPNNLLPGQLWYNPCTCTYYFECSGGFDEENNCSGYTPINYKAGAGIAYSGDCENGSYISVKILEGGGLGFDGNGNLLVDCDAIIANCGLWTRTNLTFNTEDFQLNCDNLGNCVLRLNPETPNVRSRNAGEVASAGVCLEVAPTAYVGGIAGARNAMLQLRDLSWVFGAGTLGVGPTGAYLTETFTNNWSTDALLEVDLICQDNFLALLAEARVYTPRVAFIHSITETLAVQPPAFGGGNDPARPNWAYNQISAGTPFFQENPVGSIEAGTLSPQTSSCKFTRVMAPNETVTLYYQWWAVFNEMYDSEADTYVIHGGMATASKMSRSVIPL
jgi:hypothetical protein